MAGRISVGRPRRIKHIPLSWDVNKARSNHQPKFRPVGDDILRGREKTVGQLMEEMFEQMPPASLWISGELNPQEYLNEALRIAEPFRVQVAEILQQTFNDGSLMQEDRIRADINNQLKRLNSPLRLTDSRGEVTKVSTPQKVQTVGGFKLGKSPKAEWAPIGIEAFDDVSAVSTRYAQTRSAELVTNIMIPEQQKVIQQLIGESFTTQQTFSTGRTVTGLTAQQTSQALVNVLQEVNPTTSVGQNVANFRGVNANGLTRPWEKAVYHRAERMADSLAAKGVTGVKAQMRIQRDAQRYANKLRRSRARMISRTEIKRAQVQGQIASMREALDSGLADPSTAGKKWITGATDVCEICSDLGFSRAIAVDQSFEGVGDGPPAHPNCRCDLDFAHRIKEAPRAVGAGDPNFPAGTEQNPIVWQFNSGFQTQPSATRAFTPTGFVPPPTIPPPPTPPPVQPPPVVEPTPVSPSAPTPPVQAPVKPTEIKPASNADIVWDDAGRKWADLTEEERLFLYEADIDAQLFARITDFATDVDVLGVNKSGATLPPLADDASDGVKAIRKQQEKVVKLADEQNEVLVGVKVTKQVDDDLTEQLTLGKDKILGEGHTVMGRKVIDVGEISDSGVVIITAPKLVRNPRVLKEILDDPELVGSQIQAATLKERHRIVSMRWREANGLDAVSEKVTLKLDDLYDEVDELGALIKKEAQLKTSDVPAPEDNWVTRITGITDAEDGSLTNLRSTNPELVDETSTRLFSRLTSDASRFDDELIEAIEEYVSFNVNAHRTVPVNQLTATLKSGAKSAKSSAIDQLTQRGLNAAMESAGERFLRDEVARLLKGSGLNDNSIEAAAQQVAIRFRRARIDKVQRKSPTRASSMETAVLNEIGDDITQVWKETVQQLIDEGQITKADVLDDLIPVSRLTTQTGIPMPTAGGTVQNVEAFANTKVFEKALGVRAARSINKQLPEILEDAEQYVDNVIAKLKLIDQEVLDELDGDDFSAFARYVEEVTGERFNETEIGHWANGLFYRPDALKSVDDIPVDEIKKALKKVVGKADPDEAGYATSILSDVISTDIQKYLGRDVEALILKLKDPSIVNQQVKLLTNLVDDLQTFAQGGTPEAFSEAVMEVLHQVRSFGDEAINFQAGWQTPYGEKAVGTKMTADLKNSLDMLNDVVSKWVPDDWVIQANARGRLGFYRKGNRAHYADRKVTGIGSPTVGGKADGLINIGKQGYMDESTMLHEINHRFQKNNEIQLMLEKVAVDKRVAASAPDKQKLTRIYSGDSELGFEDDFSSHYMGKVYKRHLTEVDVETQFIAEGSLPLEASTMASEGVASVKGVSQSDYDEGLMQWFIGMLAGI